MPQVLYRKEGHVAYITLNNPQSLNAVNREMVRALQEIWRDMRDDREVWVGVLNGEGKSFCSGADVKRMERGAWQFRESLIYGDDKLGHTNYGLYKPLVAAVHRHAYGAGLLLALECDVIIAAEDALLGIPEGKVNIPTLLAPFLCGFMPRCVANEMMYTGKPITARRAYELGMVNRVVPRDDLMKTATETALSICELGPLANWASKELMWRTRSLSAQDALALVEHIATPVWNAEDSAEGKAAFQEKRKPQWRVR